MGLEVKEEFVSHRPCEPDQAQEGDLAWHEVVDRGSGSDQRRRQRSAAAIRLVIRVPAPLRPIADQVIRSASSVPANLAEGHGRTGRDRVHLWRIAYASAKEVDTHLRLLSTAGAINRSATDLALDGFDQVRAMTWRLLSPKA